MIQLYHADMSTCAQKVRLVLEQKKLAWNSHLLNLRHRDQHAPEYLKLNPNGVVPTLIDHDNVIIESTVICEYLDDAYPENSLVPDAPENKALMRQWTKWLDEFLHFHTGVLSGSIAFRFQHLARPKDELEAYLSGIPDLRRRKRQRQQIELGLEAPQFRESILAFEIFLYTFSLSRFPKYLVLFIIITNLMPFPSIMMSNIAASFRWCSFVPVLKECGLIIRIQSIPRK